MGLFYDICALRVNKFVFSIYGQDFHEMNARLCWSNNVFLVEFLHFDIQSTGQKSNCVNTFYQIDRT